MKENEVLEVGDKLLDYYNMRIEYCDWIKFFYFDVKIGLSFVCFKLVII